MGRIAIIGLGLMGGSLGYALRGFEDAELTGSSRQAIVREQTVQKGAVDKAYSTAREAARGAGLVILCVPPHAVASLIYECAPVMAQGGLMTDICGVKTGLYESIEIPQKIDYIGIHPMAGREVDGFESALPDLFVNTGFLITPLPDTLPKSIERMKSLAAHIGATKISVTDPATHDAVIAYTSDLMHVSAAALCMDYHPEMTGAFCAGAFRDCTRIANINAELWTELLLDNRDYTAEALRRYIGRLQEVEKALSNNDNVLLRNLLQQAHDNKVTMLCK